MAAVIKPATPGGAIGRMRAAAAAGSSPRLDIASRAASSLKWLDTDHSGTVSFTEFLSIIYPRCVCRPVHVRIAQG